MQRISLVVDTAQLPPPTLLGMANLQQLETSQPDAHTRLEEEEREGEGRGNKTENLLTRLELKTGLNEEPSADIGVQSDG